MCSVFKSVLTAILLKMNYFSTLVTLFVILGLGLGDMDLSTCARMDDNPELMKASTEACIAKCKSQVKPFHPLFVIKSHLDENQTLAWNESVEEETETKN
ncbi:unnamed protein product [Cylicostephanus goldi]|uniref:Uncharacterized protein n=1 Tax=Cylicostephanus goldi TaxID=71465 RepID=A0A3P7QKG9_CYLGO|nr:unnamed protein product [Cylicostephanus goldi]